VVSSSQTVTGTTAHPHRPFPWVPLLVLCGAALLFVAVVAEIVLQVAERRTALLLDGQCAGSATILNGQKGLFQIDAVAGYVMRPNVCVQLRTTEYDQVLRTNNRGFAGPDVPATKAAGEYRVVVLGDSYTAGGQVPYEQNFTAVLEEQLHRLGHANVRVVNAGVGGYTTYNEAGLLREDVAWLQPDLVVVAVFLGNDVAENVLATYGGYRDAPEHPKGVTWGPAAAQLLAQSAVWFPRNGLAGDAPPPWDGSQPLPAAVGNQPAAAAPPAGQAAPPTIGTRVRRAGSDLWDAARSRSLVLGKLFGEPIDPSVTTAPGAAGPSAVQQQMNVATFEWTILRDPPRTYWLDVAWPLFGEYLTELRATADSAGARTVVLAIPDMSQFDDAMRARSMADFRLREAEVDWDRPQAQLLAQAQAAGVPVLDLLPVFRARPDRAQLDLRLDTHFSALGHAVVGQELARYLHQNGWLRPGEPGGGSPLPGDPPR
jgi:lysophospholipase L1-like esterase